MISYETAVKLKEAGVEQEVEHGDQYYSAGHCSVWTNSFCGMYQERPTAYVKAHTVPQLKALIHEWGFLQIDTKHSKRWVKVWIYHDCQEATPTHKAEASTEEEALAKAYLHIIERENPKTCGECNSRKRWMCALDGGGLCPDHQDIKDIQDAWKVTNVVFTACPNFQPKDKQC